MKEETEVSHGDKEAQQEALFNVLTEEAKELHQIVKVLKGCILNHMIGPNGRRTRKAFDRITTGATSR